MFQNPKPSTLNAQRFNFVFFGTVEFSVIVLDELKKAGFLPTLIITAPDRKKGRGMKLTPPPVKVWAQKNNVACLQPEKLDKSAISTLNAQPYTLFLVAAYGNILPKWLIDMPRHGVLNVHPSLLPRLRGPSPILSAILEDERTTGVSIMLIDEEMDHGPVLAQARIEIAPEDWPMRGSTFLKLLAREGGKLLVKTIPPWLEGTLTPEPQDEAKATYTKKFTDEEAHLDLSSDAYKNFLKIRAFDARHFDSSHRAYFVDGRGKRVIVTDAEFKNGKLRITCVIPEGKKEMSYEAFLKTL